MRLELQNLTGGICDRDVSAAKRGVFLFGIVHKILLPRFLGAMFLAGLPAVRGAY
jgi:hypothetical protein